MWAFFAGIVVGGLVPTWMLIQITIWMTKDIEHLSQERFDLWREICDLKKQRGVPPRARRPALSTRFERN